MVNSIIICNELTLIQCVWYNNNSVRVIVHVIKLLLSCKGNYEYTCVKHILLMNVWLAY